jgi:hypothetical protein
MAKYKIKCEIDSVKFEELCRLAHNLRYYSKIWKEHYGSTNLANMVNWQNKMDEWLKKNIELEPDDNLDEEIVQKGEKWQKAS